MKKEGRRVSQSAFDQFLSWVFIATVTVMLLAIIAAVIGLYWAWFDFLTHKPPHVARIWAVVATSSIPLFVAGALYVGFRLGAYKADAQLEGMGKVLEMLHRLTSIFRWRRYRDAPYTIADSPAVAPPPVQRLVSSVNQEIVEL